MGKIDHPHHAEDDRKTEADQRKVGDHIDQLKQDGDDKIHVRRSGAMGVRPRRAGPRVFVFT
jgi:hypothetical protein